MRFTSSQRGAALRLALSLTTILAAGVAAPALAQTAAPVRQSIDANGVDLFLGTFNADTPALTVGPAYGPALSYYRTYRGGIISDSLSGSLSMSGGVVTVTLGGASDRFAVSGSTYTPTEGHGATLSYNATTRTYTYTVADGTIYHFKEQWGFNGARAGLDDVVFPSGSKLTYSYNRYLRCRRPTIDDAPCNDYVATYALGSVASNGYILDFNHEADGDPDATGSGALTGVTARNVTAGETGGRTLALDDETIIATHQITSAAGRLTKFRMGYYGILGITRPGDTAETTTIAYNGARVASVVNAAGTTTYGASDAGNVRTISVTDALAHTTTYQFDIALQRMTDMTDPLARHTHWDYDATGRLVATTYPEGNAVALTYDPRGNVTETHVKAKPAIGGADLVSTAYYPPTCTGAVCNQPTWTQDARGNRTDYTYAATGQITSVTAPMDTSGVRPETRYSYTVTGGVSLLTGVSQCRTSASCANSADETRTALGYDANLQPTSMTRSSGDGTLMATATMAYDVAGNVVAVDGPLAGAGDTTSYRYDADRLPVGTIGPDPDGGGPLPRRATRTSYNSNGQVALTEAGTVTGTSDGDWAGFVTAQGVATGYDGYSRPVSTTLTAGGTTYGATRTSYDAVGRMDCTVVRMDPAQWVAQADACTPQTGGPNGPDRVTRTGYDAAGQVTAVTFAYGTADAATEQQAYTATGKPLSVTDGEGHVTTYGYDGYDRAVTTTYPGGSYEQLTLDANGNVTQRRLRDGQVIGYGYDALDRVVAKDVPGTVYWDTDKSYGYDLVGHLVRASDGNGRSLTFGYDALGRRVSQGDSWYANGAAFFQYDLAGRRTRLTWGDGFYVTFDYDPTGAMTAIRENGGPALATFGYDGLGRRTSLTRGNGTSISYGYDPASRLASLALVGGDQPDALAFAYNPAGQIVSRTGTNDAYAWRGAANADRGYGVNALNQLTSAGGTALGYDGRGNLTAADGASYGYTAENRLATRIGANLAYDPLDRLFNINAEAGVNTTLTYDGTAVLAETDEASGALLRRYVYGPGSDEPLVWYEGAGIAGRRYTHADERGSIVAVTDDAGHALAVNTYDDYGVPGPANLGRFGYTGQKWLPSLGLYDYKARMYAPALGRFMQTDPIGYGDGLNAYNYVGSDPVNFVDPLGLDGCPAPTGDETAVVCGESGKSPPSGNQVNDIPRSFGGTSGPSASSQLLDAMIAQEIAQSDIVVTCDAMCQAGETIGSVLNFAVKRLEPLVLLNDLFGIPEACCFTAGTQVLTPSGQKAIETLKIGDLVISRSAETGETAAKAIVGITPAHERRIWTVTISYKGKTGGWLNERYETTDDHPWRTEDGRWVTSAALKRGEILAREHGTGIVDITTDTGMTQPTYNLEVADFHTYFVGEASTWVHNSCIDKYGRALAKKFGKPGSAFPKVKGDPETINKAARAIYDNIIKNGTVTARYHARFGDIKDTKLRGVGGVRTYSDGGFIGFLEP